MIPSDAEIVGLMAKLYDPRAGDFDHIEDPGIDSGICWAVKHYEDVDALIFRGSMTKEDWFRDFLSEMSAPASSIPGAKFGALPLGFAAGMRDAAAVWPASCGPRLVIAGHSLGAARAAIAAGLALQDGAGVERLVLCGCPRPGTKTLKNFLIRRCGSIASYRNLSDPVCDVPTDPPWEHVVEFTALNQPPSPGVWSIFRDHSIYLYLDGVGRLGV